MHRILLCLIVRIKTKTISLKTSQHSMRTNLVNIPFYLKLNNIVLELDIVFCHLLVYKYNICIWFQYLPKLYVTKRMPEQFHLENSNFSGSLTSSLCDCTLIWSDDQLSDYNGSPSQGKQKLILRKKVDNRQNLKNYNSKNEKISQYYPYAICQRASGAMSCYQ